MTAVEWLCRRLKEMLGGLQGKTVGLLGLSFKPNTDDMRDAPAITMANRLLAAGAKVKAYDPVSMDFARPQLPGVEMASDPYSLAEGCDALMIITEWNEFKQLDLERIQKAMRQPIIFDGRNIYDPEEMKEIRFPLPRRGAWILKNLCMADQPHNICSYEGSDYQSTFWDQGERLYEDRVEAIALKAPSSVERQSAFRIGSRGRSKYTALPGF